MKLLCVICDKEHSFGNMEAAVDAGWARSKGSTNKGRFDIIMCPDCGTTENFILAVKHAIMGKAKESRV